jgi:hypothetical protein
MGQVQTVVDALIRTRAHRATKFMSPMQVVRATRRLERKRVPSDKRIEVILHIGPPNFREREFIKACKRAGEPFPVRKIKIAMPPASAKSRKAKR